MTIRSTPAHVGVWICSVLIFLGTSGRSVADGIRSSVEAEVADPLKIGKEAEKVVLQTIVSGSFSGESSVLLRGVEGRKELRISLNPSNYHYTGDDGKEYAVNLWDAPPPAFGMRLPGNRLLLVSTPPGEIGSLTWMQAQNPLYCGVIDFVKGSVVSVMKGNLLSVSSDLTAPVVIMVESFALKATVAGKPLTEDPIIFAWQPGRIRSGGLNSEFPNETAPQIVFPLGAEQMDFEMIGGYRLLCTPVWALGRSELVFAAYELSSGEPRIYLMNFEKDDTHGQPACTTLPVPGAEKQFIANMISNDTTGYLIDSKITVQWKSPDHFSLIFDGQRKYEY